MATTEKSVWMQILSGLEQTFENVVVIENNKKCVKSVNSTVLFFKTMQWNELTNMKNITTAINSTGDHFVNVVDDCTQGVNKIIRVGEVSIDFFKKISKKNILSVLYKEMQMIADSNVDVFKMIYEKKDYEEATKILSKQLIKLLSEMRENELKN